MDSARAIPLAAAAPWVVTVLADARGATWVGDPAGLTAYAQPARGRVSRAGSARAGGVVVTWAWGRLAADEPTPRVTFRRGLGRRHGEVRRLSPTLWAAQAPGEWHRVRVRVGVRNRVRVRVRVRGRRR